MAEIITVQEIKKIKKLKLKKLKKLIWMEVGIYSVKAKSQAGNKWVKDIRQHKILTLYFAMS